MSPEPTSDKVADCDQTIQTDKYSTYSYNDYPLIKLQKMILSVGKQFAENGSMDFSVFKNLTLDSMRLTYLPSNFAHHMINLLSLDLSNNELEELPHSFHLLSKLEHLKINNNALANLPNSFGELKHLKTLSLVSNSLQYLPDCFGCLVNLESLDLSCNKFTNLPTSCAMLNKVSTLILRDNNLIQIPECVTNGMKYLHVLDVSNNPQIFMNKPPASIHLTTFKAENNGNCSFFPQWILWIKYSQLRKISLDYTTFNRYHYPKERIALQITHLSIKQSNLSDNYIRDIVSNMVKLESLDLNNHSANAKVGNHFWQMPFENMRVFNTLKEVNISGTSLPNLSAKISSFGNLIKLNLSYNRISWLPEEFTMLQNLEVLQIDHSKIIQLPKDIGKMKNLRELRASQNTISQLPSSLFELNNLRVLEFYDNSTSKIPEEISGLNKLLQLDLDQNFCEVNHLIINSINYNDLQSALRTNPNFDADKRLIGIKNELDDDDENYPEDEKYYRYSGYSDSSEEESSSISDEDTTEKLEIPRVNYKSESSDEENWDVPENTADNFEPFDAGLFRAGTSYYISETANSNYYCPADDHVKPVKLILAERNLLKIEKFEEGQFDDV